MSKSADSSVTVRNIEAAFAGESMAHIKYLYFARVCRAHGDEDVPGSSKKPPPRKCSMPSVTWICSIPGKRSTR